ncbi:nucleotidyl transferase AbiEii/AbiGii toxin family protein, partial [Acinetobacter baumannii]
GQQVKQLLLLDIHELAAGKLSALIDRGAGRDIFDAFHLFKHPTLEIKTLRLLFVIYAAMSHKKNFLDIKISDIVVDRKNLQNKLIPV